MLFYQLSDIHLVGHTGRIEHRPNNARFERIVRWFLRRAQQTKKTPPILISGDVVDTPDESSFAAARTLLTPLHEAGYPLHFIPGNHDLSELGISWDASGVFTQRWKALVEHFGDCTDYPTEYVYDDTVLLGVDSSSNPTSFARGEIGTEQLARLRARLDYYSNLEKRLVVFVHHHPFDRDFTLAMVDYGAFMQTVYSRADVVLFGHKHHYAVWDDAEKIQAISCLPNSIKEHYQQCDPMARMTLMVSANRCTAPSNGFLKVLGFQADGRGTRLVPIQVYNGK